MLPTAELESRRARHSHHQPCFGAYGRRRQGCFAAGPLWASDKAWAGAARRTLTRVSLALAGRERDVLQNGCERV